MKRLRYLSIFVIFTVAIATTITANSFGQSLQDFTINSFTADYYLSKNNKGISQLEVTETITANFVNQDINHGILRALPMEYNGIDLNLKVTQVANITNGSGSYSSYKQNNNLVLKIGDARQFVNGINTYKISYKMSNVITNYDNYQELFWNINGTQWQQPIEQLSAKITMPDNLQSSLNNQLKCLSGGYGQAENNCTIINQNGAILVSSTKPLAAGENVSFVVGFAPNSFQIDKLAAVQAVARKYLPFILPPTIIISFLALLILQWARKGRDAKGRGLIIPQYTAYKPLSVLESQVLLEESLAQKGVTAQIIALAVGKIITISEISTSKKFLGLSFGSNKDYSLTLNQIPESLPETDKMVFKMLFGDNYGVGQEVKLADLKNKAYKEVEIMAKNIPKKLFEQGYFTSNPQSAFSTYLKPCLALALFFIAVAIFFILIGFLTFPGGFFLAVLLPLGFSLIVFNLLASVIMPAKSAQGTEAKEYLLGLKEYIKLAEADRLKYLQTPEGAKEYGNASENSTKIKLFEKLLPYAIIFGLEVEWVNSFKDIYSQPPDWYQGNWSTFNTGLLLGSINGFTEASSVSFAAPGSSGGSGFGGGGFSGGGGGGGGGGGW
jgi:uncharacterized membrane protein